ncbi:MAG: polymer-forming cytoskeletal protein [Myxococcota bacterium]|nr:polymer-forming cytoskeletal protein [Myxococcota bacterium]
MSEISEELLARYVDGELDADEVRRIEAHLVESREARELVLALREENEALTDAIRERDEVRSVAAGDAAAQAGLSWGLPLSVAGVSLALAGGGLLLEMRLPSGIDFLNPLRLTGAVDMAFNLFFLARDRAPAFFDLVVAVAATGSVAALGSVAVSAVSRRVLGGAAGVALMAALALLLAPGAARALELRHDQDTHIAAGETLEESLFATGDSISVDGKIRGNLIAAGERVTVRGEVEGNVYAFADQVEISGRVRGSLHSAAERIRISGTVQGATLGAGRSVLLTGDAGLGPDAGLFGKTVTVDGRVERDLVAAAELLELRGDVARHLQVLGAERVQLFETARVGGDVTARLPAGREVEIADGARIAGSVTHEDTVDEGVHGYLAAYLRPEFYLLHAIQLVASFVLGLVIFALLPRFFDVAVPSSREFFGSLGWGFVFAVCTPVAIVVTALTLIGIPLAVLALFVYVTILFLAHIMVGALLGRALLRPGDTSLGAFARRLLLGLFVLVIFAHVPFLGPPVALVVTLFGTGVLAQRGRVLLLRATAA